MWELRSYQKSAVNAFFNFIYNKAGNPLICMPTGTGKSLVISEICRIILTEYPWARILVLTHSQELVENNSKTCLSHWPNSNLGVFSSGLNRKEFSNSLIFGSIQSVASKPEIFGKRDFVIIDEAHAISPNQTTVYRKTLNVLFSFYPSMRVCGLTATPFRLGQGLLTEGESRLFTDIAIDMTSKDSFLWFIKNNFISPLIPKPTDLELDVTGVKISKGDFQKNQLQKAIDKSEVTEKALNELISEGCERKSWLIFATGVEHAQHIADILCVKGINAAAVHSKLKNNERQLIIKKFKIGEIRALVNNDILTTGFDHPAIDLIGVLRPTMSPGLWVQMLGRGTRICKGKQNCLVLDFARNTINLGTINEPNIPKKKGKRKGEAPIKICIVCNTYCNCAAKICECCGNVFEFKEKLTSKAGSNELVSGLKQSSRTPPKPPKKEIEWFDISKVIYNRNIKEGGKQSIRVCYYSGAKMFPEWIFPQGSRWLTDRFKAWWKIRAVSLPPKSIDEFLARSKEVRLPKKIKIKNSKPYIEILDYEF